VLAQLVRSNTSHQEAIVVLRWLISLQKRIVFFFLIIVFLTRITPVDMFLWDDTRIVPCDSQLWAIQCTWSITLLATSVVAVPSYLDSPPVFQFTHL